MEQHLKEKEAQALLGDHWKLLRTKAPQSGFTISENALRRGAAVRPAQKLESLTVEQNQSIIIDGDLEVTGVIELDNNARLFIRGDLIAHDVCTNGSIYVMGKTSIASVFYGAEETFEAILCGDVVIHTLLLHYNYQYIERGKRLGVSSAQHRIWDEREGADALQATVHNLGLHGPISASSIAQLLRMRSKWSTSPNSAPPAIKKSTPKPAKKIPAAKKPAAKKTPAKKSAAKKTPTKKPTTKKKTPGKKPPTKKPAAKKTKK